MSRDRLRTQGPRLTDQLNFRGFEALVLENRWLRVTCLPQKGSDIIEFLYKPLDLEFMWRAPAGFWTLERLYTGDLTSRTSFIDYYPGGWQEILPNGGPTNIYKGAPFDEHGEVALLPWSWQLESDQPAHVSVRLTVRTLRAPLRIDKTMTLREGPALFIDEVVTNEGLEPIDLMWGHHPALGAPFLDGSCVLDIPAHTGQTHPVERFPKQRLAPDRSFTWPLAQIPGSPAVDLSRVQPPHAGTADLLYLLDLDDAWYAVTNQRRQVSFGLAWTLETFPHLWYWHDANGTSGYPWYGNGYVLALEPWSSFPSMGLSEAVVRNTHIRIEPGESRSAQITATIDTGMHRVGHVSLEGAITGR
jgi:galactose mutarotase-like enzyme